MARGGFRPGAGRPVGTTKEAVQATAESTVKREARAREMSPLEYLLSIMNDETRTIELRMRAAQIAIPFTDAKPAEKGKKEERQEAAGRAASGKYAVPGVPRLN